MPYKRISVTDAKQLLDTGATCVDIRDEMSFRNGHIPGAQHLTQQTLPDFMEDADKNLPLLVCCYHGNSSQSAAEYLSQQGFADVYSVDGGFTAWGSSLPVEK